MKLKSYIPSQFELSFKGALKGPLLTLQYEWASELEIPLPHQNLQSRQVGLWEQTCFEFFFCSLHSKRYFEINLAPDGHWNSFVFDHYRQAPLTEAAELMGQTFELTKNTLSATFKIPAELVGHPLKGNACAVIAHLKGRERFMALAHAEGPPDFHAPAGFIYYLS